MRYRRMPIEAESPEQLGYGRIRRNLAESSVADASLADLGVDLDGLVLQYGDHLGLPELPGRDRRRCARGRCRRRDRDAGRRGRPVHRPHDPPRGRRPSRRGAPQLRDQRGDPACDRRGRRLPGPVPRRGMGRGSRPDRGAHDRPDAAGQPHVAAQPDRVDDRPGHARRRDRARGASRRPAAGRRDVPRDDVRRAAAGGRRTEPVGHLGQQPVEDLRAARDPDRVAGDPRPRAARPAAGRQGADPDLGIAGGRDDRPGGTPPATSPGCRSSAPGSTRRSTRRRPGSTGTSGWNGCRRAAVPSGSRGCGPGPAWIRMRSTASSSSTTGRSWARGTGSSSREPRSGSAMAGRGSAELLEGLAAIDAALEEATRAP